MSDLKSVLNLESLQFKNISFERIGNKQNNDISIGYDASFEKRVDSEVYKVTFSAHIEKEKEYLLELTLEGIFSLTDVEDMPDETKETIISKNTLAIMMPYMRSEISLLTAQPGVESVVLPPMNINKMVDG